MIIGELDRELLRHDTTYGTRIAGLFSAADQSRLAAEQAAINARQQRAAAAIEAAKSVAVAPRTWH